MEYNRRDFIKQLSLTYGSVLLLPGCFGNYSPWRFFTADEARTMIAVSEQFIPADKDPGATDANVINFIDKQLVGPYTRFQEEYRMGLKCLDAASAQLYQKPFDELDRDRQTGFLEKMEKNELPEEDWEGINQRSFFNRMLDHSMQGFYGSPRHGGNRNYVSYKMIKVDYPHIIGQNRYDSNCKTTKNAGS